MKNKLNGTKKFMCLVAISLGLTACGGNDGSEDTWYAYQGRYQFTGKFCGIVAGQYTCTETLEPIACASSQLFNTIRIGYQGDEGTVDGVLQTIVTSGNTVTLFNGQVFEIANQPGRPWYEMVFKFANGCEMKFDRR